MSKRGVCEGCFLWVFVLTFVVKIVDRKALLLYYYGARERAQSAMIREIAPKGGNFRGVCP